MQITKLYKRARELGFPTAKPKNSDREVFTSFISFEEDRRKKIQKRSTARLMSHIQSEFNIPKERATKMQRNQIIGYINEKQKKAYEQKKRERLSTIRREKKQAQLAARPQIVKLTAEQKRLRRNERARERRAEVNNGKMRESSFQKHLKEILIPVRILDSTKNGYHRIFQVYEIPHEYPEKTGVVGIALEFARIISSVGGNLPHLIDVSAVQKFMTFYKETIDTIVKESLKEGPQKIGFGFDVGNIDHTVIEGNRTFNFNSYKTVSMADHEENVKNC